LKNVQRDESNYLKTHGRLIWLEKRDIQWNYHMQRRAMAQHYKGMLARRRTNPVLAPSAALQCSTVRKKLQ
jgi:hypothetical protein